MDNSQTHEKTIGNLNLPNNNSSSNPDTSLLTPDGTIFVSEQDQFLLIPTTPAFSTASSNKSAGDSNEFDRAQLGLALIKMGTQNSSTPHPLTSEILDDIQYHELTKLKTELKKAKNDLSQLTLSHNQQIDHYQVLLNKVKAEGEFIGVVKSKKQRNSMKKVKLDYESELQEINHKLHQTQKQHISQSQQIKQSELKFKLQIKLKDEKIRALMQGNAQLTQSIVQNKKMYDADLENVRQECEEQIESEINKRIQQVSQAKQAKSATIYGKDEEHSHDNLNMDEKDKLINSLKSEIKRLEIRYEEEQEMFFKHSEIFDAKLEREAKDKKRLNKKLLQQRVEYETEMKGLNSKINNISEMLSEQNEINIHLQNNLVLLNGENERYKNMEMDYKLVADNIETDYEEMNTNIQVLRDRNKEKEEELTAVKQELTAVHRNVRSHNATIMELESVLKGLRDDEDRFEDKKNEIDNLNVQINDISLSTPIARNAAAANEEDSKEEFGFTISYLSNGVDDETQLKHVNELENIKKEYNELIYKMKNELSDVEVSKIECLKHFTVAIDEMRVEIKKQCCFQM